MAAETASPMARAWLAIALRLHDMEVPATPDVDSSPDILITAIEALASPEGNYKFFRSGGIA
jgi:hypothetical protein